MADRDDLIEAVFAEARATLERTASVKVEHRAYDDDALVRWSSNMPKSAPTPAPSHGLTGAQIAQLVATGIATALIEERQRAKARHDAVGDALGAERARHRELIQQTRDEFAEDLAALRGQVSDIREELLGEIKALQAKIDKAQNSAEVIDLPRAERSRRA